MKRYLFIILVAVAAVLLWAIRTEAYSNGLVFSLGLVVTALSGYLIADYFFRLEKSSLKNNLHVAQKENQALKERVDLLQTQLTTATPHAEVEQFEQRISILEDEKTKLDGISRAQTAEIANLKEKLDALQQTHSRSLEESTISTETAQSQTVALQGEVNSTKLEMQAIKEENAALHTQNKALFEELDKTTTTSEITEGGGERSISNNTDPIAAARELIVTELDERFIPAHDPDVDYGKSDNLQAVNGIGPKVETVLKAAEIPNWEMLSMISPERLRVILGNAGNDYSHIDPTSWPEQARFLVHGEFTNLKKYQDSLAGN